MPSSRAAWVRLPPVAARARSMTSVSHCRRAAAQREVRRAAVGRRRVRGQHVGRQLAHADAVPAREDDRALDHVLELAHVAGPGVRHELLERLLRHLAHGLAEGRREAREAVIDQQRDVLPPLAQGRHAHAQHVQAVEEILAEAPGFDVAFDVAGRRGQDPHVDLAGLGISDGPDLLLLEGAQQLRLERRRQLGDLVEEERSAVGLHEEAPARAVGAGEGAAGVAEELALQQVLRNRRAVDRHERAAASRRLGVDGPGENLLAGAALAGEQHRGLELCRALDELQHLDHDVRGGDDRPLSDDALDVPPQQRVLAAQAFALPGLAQGQQRLGGREGLREVVVGAPLHGFDGEIRAAMGRHQDQGGAGQPARQLRQKLEPIDARHPQVAEHRVHRALLEQGERRGPVRGRQHLVLLGRQDERQALPQGLVVVHDQDTERHRKPYRLTHPRPCSRADAAEVFRRCAACGPSAAPAHAGCGSAAANGNVIRLTVRPRKAPQVPVTAGRYCST